MAVKYERVLIDQGKKLSEAEMKLIDDMEERIDALLLEDYDGKNEFRTPIPNHDIMAIVLARRYIKAGWYAYDWWQGDERVLILSPVPRPINQVR